MQKNNVPQRQRSLGPGVQYLIEYLKRMQGENPGFFYAIEADNEHSGNFFWADAISRANYSHFGDSVRVDTSYRTNRSKIPFVIFTGINHHAQPVLFGCALLLNESENTFIWLLQTWLRAMSGHGPVSITSDPDRLIQMAVAQVFPDSRNRFCRWSIFRQTQEKLANVYQENPAFDFEFKKCVNEAETVEEFESSWATLWGRYFLMDNEWLISLYNIRDQWVPVYLRDVFFGELSTSECSDALGLFFTGFSSTTPTNIQLLIKQYEKIVSTWHGKELKEDFDTSNTIPVLKTPSPMEKQAANLYTRRIFMKFQGELVETLANPATILDDSGSVTTYRVAKFGEEHKAHIVRFNAFEMKATCSCRMFEFSGIICRHILSVFRAKNVLMLPSEYVLKRWTRNAKASGVESTTESTVGLPSNYQEALRQEALKFVEEGAKSIHVYNVAMSALHEATRQVAAAKSKNSENAQATSEANGGNLEMSSTENQSSSHVSKDEKEKKIRELANELERTNQKCEVYRAILLALFRDTEDQKLKLSVKVQNARLSLKD
ncbi:protein FAR1-RELATED SEQUENCE 9 [Andrographis paniculata]|uniref:protein FAR1-RELATED SEQUENCE 9 n=1 Tax=Andrographis paniculata TaxID=175694 RepID=UPI0021E780BB|nr:protein FAR1-RELATED SEQUENCE 9 [Andrographis paniculata]XP_051135355.1 protein FAR1-RELATED SEQUENCE 9 [Andrographis paniculata]XP_051135356.1 protein FAR1-RELATED SEQUENCE 9 [Andrographis paniculata]XP_051135357.1 protein FAR1-RELATED SEQUENCE 9 [Andrographis paniculata]